MKTYHPKHEFNLTNYKIKETIPLRVVMLKTNSRNKKSRMIIILKSLNV